MLPTLAADCMVDALMNALKCPVPGIAPQWLQSIATSLQAIHEYARYPFKEIHVVTNPILPTNGNRWGLFKMKSCWEWNACAFGTWGPLQ